MAMCVELMTSRSRQGSVLAVLKKTRCRTPGSVSRHTFSPELVETIAEYVGEHGIQAGTQRFTVPRSTVHVLYKNGFTQRARDGFSRYGPGTWLTEWTGHMVDSWKPT